MKDIYVVFFSTFLVTQLFAQQGNGGRPKSWSAYQPEQIHTVQFSTPDIKALRAEDEINDQQRRGPWRFGYNNDTNLTMMNSGTWVNLPDGSRFWFLKVICKNALTVNITFKDVQLPKGNTMYVYSPKKAFILGAFTENHLYEGALGTELIPGESAVIEYFIPSENAQKTFGLTLSKVTHGYRTAGEFNEKAFGDAGGCNVNVNCPLGNAWSKERNSVVMLVSGSNGFCSGALVNNTLYDAKPYVLTANHCYTNGSASWIFRFNWQSPDCENPSTSPSFQSLSGAVLRAKATESDFCLLEITGGLESGTIPKSFTPYFSGWDNSGEIPLSGTGIHHPTSDIKKISIENDPLISSTFSGSPADSHWGVTGWDFGVTEVGSSGSPLFDQNHRIVGQLRGGNSGCGKMDQSDWYGKFSYSWNPVGSNSKNQLKYWLDPTSSGAVFVDGYDPNNPKKLDVDAGLYIMKKNSPTLCSGIVSPTITLFNSGFQLLSTATIKYGFDGVADQTVYWSGSLPQWQTVSITLPPSTTLIGGKHTFIARIESPNGGKDGNPQNDVVTWLFNVVMNGETVVLSLDLDCSASETSWYLADKFTEEVLFSGSGYSDHQPGIITENFCLNKGCYTFTIKDTYGDGLTNCEPVNGGNGNYQLKWNDSVLAQIVDSNADFGYQNKQFFCILLNDATTLALDEQIQLYPNPTDTYVKVASSLDNPITQISVYDLSGKICLKSVNAQEENAMKIDVSNLSAGFYTIYIEVNHGGIFKSLIVN